VFVVNKADREGAQATARDLRAMVSLGERPGAGWRPPVLSTVATTSVGVDELVVALERHAEWLQASGEFVRRRLRRAESELEAITLERLRERLGDLRGGAALPALASRVLAQELDPYAAADELVANLAAHREGSPRDWTARKG